MQKKAYEVVLPGFDGSTDETDDLVKWGWAYCEEAIHCKYGECKVHEIEPFFVENIEPDFDL